MDVWGMTESVERDILRRDFTVNSLFWRLPRGPLLDLVGGLDDLEAGRIRVVRPENLTDDPLRVLRGVRMLASHPRLRLTSETERHLRSAARLLREVAHERVCDELRKLLAGPAAARAVSAAERLGVLAVLFPAWEGFRHGADVARLAGSLQRLRRGPRERLARGAAEIAPAVLAAPYGGFPGEWQRGRRRLRRSRRSAGRPEPPNARRRGPLSGSASCSCSTATGPARTSSRSRPAT